MIPQHRRQALYGGLFVTVRRPVLRAGDPPPMHAKAKAPLECSRRGLLSMAKTRN